MRYVAIAVACLLTASAIRADDAEPPVVPYEGVHLFCHVLHTNKMTPIASFAEAMTDPKQATIIIFGDPAFITKIPKKDVRLATFVENGGSLLIATDHKFKAGALSVRFRVGPITAPDEAFAYRQEKNCPLLSYVDKVPQAIIRKPDGALEIKFRDFRDHPLFGLLHHGIATNFPGEVQIVGNGRGLETLLPYPFTLWMADRFERTPLNMVGSPKNAPPRGRQLYIAGHGMFINAMMAQTDNDNFEFANNAVRWLREGPENGPQHSKVLFYLNGEVINHFDMKLTPPIPPIPIPPAEALNRLVRGWEKERFFQKLLADALGPNMGRFIAVVLAIVTFIVLIYGTKKFMESRHHLETAVPMLLGPPPVAKTPSEERQQAMLRKGDFGEPSRRLALGWLQQEFDVNPDRWLAGIEAKFQAAGNFWPRWRLQRQADFILRLARSGSQSRLSRHQFFVLVETLRDLSAAAQDGRLALLVDGKSAGSKSPTNSH